MFVHFAVILIIFRKKKVNFPQIDYDSLFYCIENNLRELGIGDVGVNKRMKDLNKVFYDILLKINLDRENFKLNKDLIFKYFQSIDKINDDKYQFLHDYINKFYHFCFDISPENMIKDALNFKS
tara:strand:- start:119 stop:490 length:372 start_codon:yes stop_codon:yes gene_type:complete